MKRTIYEAPRTVLYRVEVEGVICGSATVENPNQDYGRIDQHQVNTDFGGDFSDSGWDPDPGTNAASF